MKLEKIVENVYRRLLNEEENVESLKQKMLSKLAGMASEGLGVVVSNKSQFSDIAIVLYKTNVFVGNVLASLDTETKKGGDVGSIQDAVKKSVVGMMGLDAPSQPCNNAYQVSYVAGSGYTAILHEIAMQVVPTKTIMPDRGAVSDYLLPTYQKMLKRGDVKATPFDDIDAHANGEFKYDHPNHTEDSKDDCETWAHDFPDRSYLDYSYSGASSDYSTLKKNHEDAMKMLSRYLKDYMGWDDSNVEELLNFGAQALFLDVYSGIPGEKKGLKRP